MEDIKNNKQQDSKEDIEQRHHRSIAEKIIGCLEDLVDLTEENIGIEIINYTNPKYCSVIINNNKGNKVAINIHKVE